MKEDGDNDSVGPPYRETMALGEDLISEVEQDAIEQDLVIPVIIKNPKTSHFQNYAAEDSIVFSYFSVPVTLAVDLFEFDALVDDQVVP